MKDLDKYPLTKQQKNVLSLIPAVDDTAGSDSDSDFLSETWKGCEVTVTPVYWAER